MSYFQGATKLEGGGGATKKIIFLCFPKHLSHAILAAVNYSKKTGFFKDQNAGFSAQIYRVALIKIWFKKRHDILITSYNR